MAWPSGTSVRSSILSNLVTTLQGITGSPTYKTTVQRVTLAGIDPSAITVDPAILVVPARVAASDDRLELIMGTMTTTLVLALRDQTTAEAGGANVPTPVYDFIEDVRLALLTDVTRGGFARDTHVLSDDPFPLDVSDPLWGAELSISIDYAHSRSDPTLGY
jgi:hypothetical protein